MYQTSVRAILLNYSWQSTLKIIFIVWVQVLWCTEVKSQPPPKSAVLQKHIVYLSFSFRHLWLHSSVRNPLLHPWPNEQWCYFSGVLFHHMTLWKWLYYSALLSTHLCIWGLNFLQVVLSLPERQKLYKNMLNMDYIQRHVHVSKSQNI